MPVWTHPGVYLGIPLEWGGSKIQRLQWLKEKVMNKMEGWKGNLLNPVGKEVLIKVVLQAIPTYIMSILKLPKSFCNKLSVEIARFWWSFPRNNRDIHWKKGNLMFP